MPSSYSASLRFELQYTGENINLWGEKLNTAIERIDFSIAGFTSMALTASRALTSSNTATDEARSACLKFTGTGAFTITAPSVSKVYVVWNACTGDVTMTTGSGTTVDVNPSEIALLMCDGTNFKRVQGVDFGSQELTNLAEPTASTSAATRAYVDAQAWAAVNADLPSQVGNAGKFLTTNATTPAWEQPTVSDISDYASDQVTKQADALGAAMSFAIAMAVAL